jgi:4-amino-4-deoxy-L-arabinose transferase-like glycosyltransferase
MSDRLIDHPGRVLSAIVVGGGVLAVVQQSLTLLSPPVDVVDAYAVGPAWVIGTFKHPALPNWFLEISRLVTGAVGWPAYVLGRAFVVIAFWFAYLLGRDLVGAQRAAIAVAALTAVEYFSWRSYNFNHNLAQLPFWTGSAFFMWRAVDRGHVAYWIALGLTCAAGLYTKLSFALLPAALGLWLLIDPVARRCLVTPGPWLALAAFASALVPLALWLHNSDYLLFTYAAGRVGGSDVTDAAEFAGGFLARIAPILILLAIAGGQNALAARRRGMPLVERPDRRLAYAAWIAFVPAAIALVAAFGLDARINATWLVPNATLLPIALVALAPAVFDRAAWKNAAIAAGAVALVLPIIHAVMLMRPSTRDGRVTRITWPQQEITARMRAIWQRERGTPLHAVMGLEWTAGLVALNGKQQAFVVPTGQLALTPWVTQSDIDRHGALVVWDSTMPPPLAERVTKELAPVVAGRIVAKERFKWPRARPTEPDLVISYVIIPPRK